MTVGELIQQLRKFPITNSDHVIIEDTAGITCEINEVAFIDNGSKGTAVFLTAKKE